MAKSRMEGWLALIVLVIGGAIAGLLGMWGFMAATPPLHPNAQDVPSKIGTTPAQAWAGAAAEGRHIVLDGLTEQSLPGLSVAVGVGGDIVWSEGFGWADLDKRVPVTPDTKFRIGTASQALTSAAVGMLLEDGRLKLDDVVQAYVPEFPQQPSQVTLRQLMAHTAGVPDDGGDEGPLFAEQCARPVDALRFFSGRERELLFEPGTRYMHSSYGWIVVSAAVEAAAREPFLTFMHTRIFEPLRMRDTMADSATRAIENRTTSYFPRFAADPRYGLHPMRSIDLSCYAGASVFLSTPSDLVRFGMAVNSGTLLKPATVQLLQAPQRIASGEETGHGLGWDVEPVPTAGGRTRAVGHDGTVLGGTVASFMTFPERGIAVAVATNISYADTPGIAAKIAQAFAEQQSKAARQETDPPPAGLPVLNR